VRTINDTDKSIRTEGIQKNPTEKPIDIQIFTSPNSGLSKYGLWELDRIIRDPNNTLPRGNYRIIEVPVDRNHELFEKMRVYVVPTTIVGNQRIIGVPNERMLEQVLHEHLAKLEPTS